MVSIHDGNPHKTINKLAEALKDTINTPEWAKFVKTGAGKERLPDDENWYTIRAAAILRTVYIRGPIGVEKLRTKYGCKKNRGHKPEKFYKASGKIIRSILQDLEKAELIVQKVINKHKGRVVTNKGKSLVDKNTAR